MHFRKMKRVSLWSNFWQQKTPQSQRPVRPQRGSNHFQDGEQFSDVLGQLATGRCLELMICRIQNRQFVINIQEL